ncbi:MAG: LacI family DNA-binding transcriptional regulator [Streptococcus salivarius]
MVAKLTDVAELAGVSPTTVSRVINKKGYLSQKTIDKVHAAMQELNYKPNNLARGLQGKSAKLVGLIFPNISNVFYAELIERLEDELFKQGYKTIICNSEHDPNKERDYLEMLAANQCDGIISSSHNLGIEDYEKVEAPIVAFDRNLAPKIPIVSSDNFEGGKLAARALVKAGCQRIVMITGYDNSDSPTGLRQLGFNYELDKKGIICPVPNDLSLMRRELEIKSIISREKPEAFCFGRFNSYLGYEVARQMELSIPDDLKIIGYDGTAFIRHFYPELATIQQPLDEIAKLCVEILLKKIKGKTVNRDYVLPVNLIAGGSI